MCGWSPGEKLEEGREYSSPEPSTSSWISDSFFCYYGRINPIVLTHRGIFTLLLGITATTIPRYQMADSRDWKYISVDLWLWFGTPSLSKVLNLTVYNQGHTQFHMQACLLLYTCHCNWGQYVVKGDWPESCTPGRSSPGLFNLWLWKWSVKWTF